MTTPSSNEPQNESEEIKSADITRHCKNINTYEGFYEAWREESPAGLNDKFSQELHDLLKGKNSQD